MNILFDAFSNILLYIKEYPLATAIQILTTFPYARAFWWDNKKDVLNWVAVSCFLFAIGYYLFSAYSGIIIAFGTLASAIIGQCLNKKEKKQNIQVIKRIWFFLTLVVVTIVVGLIFEQNAIMWLILIAGFLDYFAYIVFREYGRMMHWVLILSQITLVVYEVIYKLYLFALLDFITAIVITVHLVKILNISDAKKTYTCKKI
ncbi:MAG: YgjV family protein [Candidatus Cloacimonetes bacterium]|nr:YgjV family protein [Candidatus Cloacimonadota bacterium]